MVQFRKSKKAGPLRFTLSQRGLSSSIGGGPFRVGFGPDRRIRRTVRIPGTGIYDTKVVGGSRSRRRSAGHPLLVLLLFLFLFLLGLAIAYWKVTLTIAIVIAVAWGAYVLIRRKQDRLPTPMVSDSGQTLRTQPPSPQTSGSGQSCKSTERILHDYLVAKCQADKAKESAEGKAALDDPQMPTAAQTVGPVSSFLRAFVNGFRDGFRRSS